MEKKKARETENSVRQTESKGRLAFQRIRSLAGQLALWLCPESGGGGGGEEKDTEAKGPCCLAGDGD